VSEKKDRNAENTERRGGGAAQKCMGPEPIPWIDGKPCFSWFEHVLLGENRKACQFQIIYEHRLCLEGREQGPLIYTLTLLPGETVRLYVTDRYRRVRAESERVSIHASLRQTVAAIHESRASGSVSVFQQNISQARSDSDISASTGGLIGALFGGASGGTSNSSTTESIGSIRINTVASTFERSLESATQMVEAERSVIVSTFEDEEHRESTVRTFANHNDCYPVTYFIRRVLEGYSLCSVIREIIWRGPGESEWHPFDNRDEVKKACRNISIEDLPKVGEEVKSKRTFLVPTEGVLFEPELAHCPSCEPVRMEQKKIDLELQNLEVKRRQKLLEAGELGVFEPTPSPTTSEE